MNVTGKKNPRSTPETRIEKRIQAQNIGALQNFLVQQPMLVIYFVVVLGLAGLIEKLY